MSQAKISEFWVHVKSLSFGKISTIFITPKSLGVICNYNFFRLFATHFPQFSTAQSTEKEKKNLLQHWFTLFLKDHKNGLEIYMKNDLDNRSSHYSAKIVDHKVLPEKQANPFGCKKVSKSIYLFLKKHLLCSIYFKWASS